jgi:hypothetical protein
MKGPQIEMISIPSKVIQEVKEENGAEEIKITEDYQLLSAQPRLNSQDVAGFTRSDSKTRTYLEYATNWGRAFNAIMTDLKWLNSFARLNTIIC